MTYKIAIIGMGKIAHDQHVPVIAKNPDFELAAVVSQRGVHPPGVPVFASSRELYEKIPNLDAVAICTPPAVRHAFAREALAAGKHVLLEKPPTPTLAELSHLEAAARGKRVLFTTWHSRFNAAVAEAKARLAGSSIRSLEVEWKEDVRRWHPGQEWIWQPGGFGVFDPGINALSIVTKILPEPIFADSATIEVPANAATPIAANIRFKRGDGAAADLSAALDWRQETGETWEIEIGTKDGLVLHLNKGGSILIVNGKIAHEAVLHEYEDI